MRINKKAVILKDGRCALLRCAEVSDAKALNECFDKTKTQTKYISMSPDDTTSLAEQEERIQRYLDSEREVLLIAEIDGQIAGSCTFGNRRPLQRTAHRASIGIALEESYTNAGLGSEMMLYAIETCKNMGFERLELGYIMGNERAYKVYRRLGFKETGRIPMCFKYEDWTYADEVLMSMSLV